MKSQENVHPFWDNPRTVVLSRKGELIVWNRVFGQVALDYRFAPELCWPRAAQQRGAVQNLVGWGQGQLLHVPALPRSGRSRGAAGPVADGRERRAPHGKRAKEVGLFDEAIGLANQAPCDPKTLTRAAWDFAARRPEFAVEAGLTALHWLAEGFGYEVTGADVWIAYTETMKAAETAGCAGEVRDRIRTLVARETYGERFVTRTLGRALGL